jgi:hypothetical protein
MEMNDQKIVVDKMISKLKLVPVSFIMPIGLLGSDMMHEYTA